MFRHLNISPHISECKESTLSPLQRESKHWRNPDLRQAEGATGFVTEQLEENYILFKCCMQTITAAISQQHSIYEVGRVPEGSPHFFFQSVLSVQAVTGHLCLHLCPRTALSSDRVEQRHGNSLSRLLESCYQVLDVTERPFRHAGSSL